MLVLANTLVPVTSLLVGLVSFGLGVVDVADDGADCEARLDEAELDHPPKCGEIVNPFRGSSASDASDLTSFRVSEIDVCDPSNPRASVLRHSLLEHAVDCADADREKSFEDASQDQTFESDAAGEGKKTKKKAKKKGKGKHAADGADADPEKSFEDASQDQTFESDAAKGKKTKKKAKKKGKGKHAADAADADVEKGALEIDNPLNPEEGEGEGDAEADEVFDPLGSGAPGLEGARASRASGDLRTSIFEGFREAKTAGHGAAGEGKKAKKKGKKGKGKKGKGVDLLATAELDFSEDSNTE
jgi:hypothetical protein